MKEKLEDSATKFILDLEARLADGVAPPPELEALRKARDDDSDEKTLALKIYELMIEQGMCYDIDAETGKLSPTQFDIKMETPFRRVTRQIGSTHTWVDPRPLRCIYARGLRFFYVRHRVSFMGLPLPILLRLPDPLRRQQDPQDQPNPARHARS